MPLGERGDGGDARDADQLLDALIVSEEEEAVVDDGRAEGGSEEVAAVLGFAGGAGKIVASVQAFVAEELEEGAVDGIGAGARGDVDDAAVEAAELGRDVVGLDGELLDVVEDGEEGDLAGFGLQGGDAVVEVLVGAGTAAVDAGEEGAGGELDAGREGGELYEVARVERHRDDGGAGDVGLDLARLCLEEGRVAVDGYGLAVASRAEDEVGVDGLAEDDGDAGAAEMLESRRCHVDAIDARVEIGEEVVACAGAGGGLMQVGRGLGQLDLGAEYGGAGGVQHAASDIGCNLSKAGGAAREQDKAKDVKCRVKLHESQSWARRADLDPAMDGRWMGAGRAESEDIEFSQDASRRCNEFMRLKTYRQTDWFCGSLLSGSFSNVFFRKDHRGAQS